MRHGCNCSNLWTGKTRYPNITHGKGHLNKSQMGRKRTVAWSKLGARVHWNHWNQGTSLRRSNIPEKSPKCQEAFLSWKSLCRDLCITKHFPHTVVWGAQLGGGCQATLLPGGMAGPWGSSGCWRSVALQLNEVLLRHPSAQDHGGTRPWDLHRKTLLHRVFVSAIWLSWSPLSFACFASPHSTTLLNTRNSTCYPLCVYILSQEDWDFTGGCFCGQRQKLRSTSVGMGVYSRRLQRVLLGHARTLPLKSNGTLILFLLATTIGMAWHLSMRFTEGKATHRWARRRECCYRQCSVYGSSFPYTIQSYSHCKDRC